MVGDHGGDNKDIDGSANNDRSMVVVIDIVKLVVAAKTMTVRDSHERMRYKLVLNIFINLIELKSNMMIRGFSYQMGWDMKHNPTTRKTL